MLGLLAATITLKPVPFTTNIFLFADRGLVKNISKSKELLISAMGDVRAKGQTFTIIDGSEITDSQNWPPQSGTIGVGRLNRTPTTTKKGAKTLDQELDETFDFLRFELPSWNSTGSGNTSIPIYSEGAFIGAVPPNKDSRLLCTIKLAKHLTYKEEASKSPDMPIGVFVSQLSVTETISKLQEANALTQQIVVCAWGHGGDAHPNYISFPSSTMVKHYKIGFDGKKWFANLEKVYR
ncbi:MAG TPA: hypothetical protein VK171_07730 [Fimbriimonas sp.]|nr:hypothetical protein [Fimbriimonas sp.]